MRRTVADFSDSLRRFLILAILAVAVLEAAVVLGRVWAAVWAWYQFVGYGGHGHIAAGRNTQMIFYSISAVFLMVGCSLSKTELAGVSKAWKVVARVSWLAIAACALFWGGFVLTPLVAFQPASEL